MTDVLDPERSAAAYGDGSQPAYEAGREIAHAGAAEPLHRLAEGCWAFGAVTLEDGRRQIVTFALPGDPVNAAAVLGGRPDVQLYALTDVRLTAGAPGDTASALAAVLVQAARLDDLAVSLGRRTAYERIAIFLLQIAERLDRGRAAGASRYRVPLRLEHLADHLGLSVVHVSRTLRQLRTDGLARLYRGELELGDRAALARLRDHGEGAP